jgi:hypothetical protein
VGDFHLLFFASFLAHSASGQSRKNSNRANVFRSSPNSGHSAVLDLSTANLAASRIFFKQLANRHDAHAAKIISFLQNYEMLHHCLID